MNIKCDCSMLIAVMWNDGDDYVGDKGDGNNHVKDEVKNYDGKKCSYRIFVSFHSND